MSTRTNNLLMKSEEETTVVERSTSNSMEPLCFEPQTNINHEDFHVFGHLSVEKVLDTVGDSGYYQKSIVLTSILVLFGGAFVSFSVSFLVSEPQFQCELKDRPGMWVECSESIACSDQYSRPSPAFSSWTQTYNLTCENKVMRESGKSMCLMLNGIVCFLTLNLADILGRKFMIVSNSILLMVSLCLAYFSNIYFLKMGLIGVAFGCQGAFSSLFVFMMNEVSRK